jgi:alpha-1,6-mannosyltransferase
MTTKSQRTKRRSPRGDVVARARGCIAGQGSACVLGAAASSLLLYALAFLAQRSLGTGDRTSAAPALAAYAATTGALFALYVLVVRASRRDGLRSPWSRRLALGAPIAFYAVAVLAPPTLSIDVLSYVAHGAVRVELGANPYVTPASAVAGTALGRDLASYGWRPVHPVTPYGPLWSDVEVAAVEAASGARARLLLLKGAQALASLGAAWAIWTLLGRVRPEHRLAGTLAYLWNPMIVAEVGADGHNDAVMVLLVVLSLALLLRRSAAGFVATTLGALVKYLPLMLLPAQVAFVARDDRTAGRRIRIAAAAATASVAAIVLAFAPYWVGARTFSGLSRSAAAADTGSTVTLAREAISKLAGTDLGEPLRLAALGAFVVVVALLSMRVRDPRSLLRASAWIGFAALVASPTYWPWYAVLPVALAALVPETPFPALLVAVSAGARAAAPLDVLFVGDALGRGGFLLLSWLFGLGIPAVVLAWTAARGRVDAAR